MNSAGWLALSQEIDLAPQGRVSERDQEWARAFLRDHAFPGAERLPLWILQPWQDDHRGALPVEDWDRLIRPFAGRARFWQIGHEGDGAIQGCEYYFLARPNSSRDARHLMALVAQAQAYIGIEAVPRHVAGLQQIPSLIFGERAASALYLKERTLALPDLGRDACLEEATRWIESRLVLSAG